MKSDKNLIFADIVYFGFFASLAVMRGVNFNLNQQSGGIVDEASCIPTLHTIYILHYTKVFHCLVDMQCRMMHDGFHN